MPKPKVTVRGLTKRQHVTSLDEKVLSAAVQLPYCIGSSCELILCTGCAFGLVHFILSFLACLVNVASVVAVMSCVLEKTRSSLWMFLFH